MQFAHVAYIPKMVQAIFYAMVINDTVELRLIRRVIGESLMLYLQELRWDMIEAWLLSMEDKLKDSPVPRFWRQCITLGHAQWLLRGYGTRPSVERRGVVLRFPSPCTSPL